MEAYSGFAQVYDAFMDNVPYEKWKDYIKELLCERGISDGLLVDLGCGTGTMADLLDKEGYDVIGVDGSAEMLDIARQKRPDMLFLNQDMRSFELYGTVRAIISICDCMNYILDKDELLEVFRWVNNYLDPRGVFIFDLNSPYKYKKMLADRTFAEDRQECSFIWENHFDEEDGINEYGLSLFVRKEDGSGSEGVYSKYKEYHYQRCYEISEITDLLEEANLSVEAVYDAFTKEAPRPDSERIYIIARECTKSWDDLSDDIIYEDEQELEQMMEEHTPGYSRD